MSKTVEARLLINAFKLFSLLMICLFKTFPERSSPFQHPDLCWLQPEVLVSTLDPPMTRTLQHMLSIPEMW